MKPEPVMPMVNHDDGTVTVAITFEWNRPWAMDRCEVAELLGRMRVVLQEGLDHEFIRAFEYRCWEPHEESLLGYLADYSRPFCPACRETLVDDGKWFWKHAGETSCTFLDNGEGRIECPNLLRVTFDREEAS